MPSSLRVAFEGMKSQERNGNEGVVFVLIECGPGKKIVKFLRKITVIHFEYFLLRDHGKLFINFALEIKG